MNETYLQQHMKRSKTCKELRERVASAGGQVQPMVIEGAAAGAAPAAAPAAAAAGGEFFLNGRKVVLFVPGEHEKPAQGCGLEHFSDEIQICDEAREILDKLFELGINNKHNRKSAIQMEEGLEALPLHMQVDRHVCQAFISAR